MKKIISLLLIGCLLCCSSFALPAYAASVEPNYSTEIQPREIMTISKSAQLLYGSIYVVNINIPYTISTALGNRTSFRIASIGTPSITSYYRWTQVRNVQIVSTTYYDNYQKAVLHISYEASIGSGFNTYTDSVTITVPNY